MPISRDSAQQICQYLDRVFPSSRWGNDERVLFIDRCQRMDLSREQWEAAIGEYRVNAEYGSPNMAEVLKVLAQASRPVRKPMAAASRGNRSWMRVDLHRKDLNMDGGSDDEVMFAHTRALIRLKGHEHAFGYCFDCMMDYHKDAERVFNEMGYGLQNENVKDWITNARNVLAERKARRTVKC